MKVGIPVIAAGLPDLKHLIKKYKVGFYFKPGDKRELAKLIKKLPRVQNKKIFFSENTKKAAEVFSINKSAQRFKEIAIWEKAYSEF